MSLSVHVQCHGHPSKERLVLDGLSRAEAALLSKNLAWKELDVKDQKKKRERRQEHGGDGVGLGGWGP